MENKVINCNGIKISNSKKISLISGPCQLETEQHAMDMAGTIKEIGSPSDSALITSGSVALQEFEYTATSNQTTFSGSDAGSQTLAYTANSIMVFVNGVLQDDTVDYTATNGTSVVFTSGLATNDEVRIMSFSVVATGHNPTKLDSITTVNGQATYALTAGGSAHTPSAQNALTVSINGVTQEPGSSFTVSGSNITFSPALATGDVVDEMNDIKFRSEEPDIALVMKILEVNGLSHEEARAEAVRREPRDTGRTSGVGYF